MALFGSELSVDGIAGLLTRVTDTSELPTAPIAPSISGGVSTKMGPAKEGSPNIRARHPSAGAQTLMLLGALALAYVCKNQTLAGLAVVLVRLQET